MEEKRKRFLNGLGKEDSDKERAKMEVKKEVEQKWEEK
jgi:hypothetical protein